MRKPQIIDISWEDLSGRGEFTDEEWKNIAQEGFPHALSDVLV